MLHNIYVRTVATSNQDCLSSSSQWAIGWSAKGVSTTLQMKGLESQNFAFHRKHKASWQKNAVRSISTSLLFGVLPKVISEHPHYHATSPALVVGVVVIIIIEMKDPWLWVVVVIIMIKMEDPRYRVRGQGLGEPNLCHQGHTLHRICHRCHHHQHRNPHTSIIIVIIKISHDNMNDNSPYICFCILCLYFVFVFVFVSP